ncbi:MAG: S1C family serine protease [Actinomycetota bacterium]
MAVVRPIHADDVLPLADGRRNGGPSDVEALDAYSSVVTGVAERLLPSVASVRVMRRVPGGRRGEGAGSAIVISPDGFLLTSAHVVHGTDGGSATFSDGRELELDVMGEDALSDLAVLRVPASDLPPARFGDADRLRVGQLVVAVGNPMGFSGSVTAGVVSALGRSLPTRAGANARIVENVIQTDVALNPGNSGGALAEGSGEVVGVATAVAGFGLGLAVPVNGITRGIVAALLSEGRYRRAFLGIAGGPRPLPPRVAGEVGRRGGVEVVQVVGGSPADRAGLRAEDLIVEVDGVPVEDMGDLQRLMTSERIGERTELRVFRGGRMEALPVVPVELTES